MNLDDLTIGQAKQAPHPYECLIGKNIMIRTVTMIFTGRLVAVYPQELVIIDATWIADTKRWQQFIADGGIDECEPYPDGQTVIVGRQSLIDATEWLVDLPRAQK